MIKKLKSTLYFLSFLLIILFIFVSQDYSHLIKYKSFTLDNGLQVFLVPKTDTPLVSVWLASKTGAYTETVDTNGLTHLFEHMFFKANKNMKSAEDYFEQLNKLGIIYNGYTSKEYVYYFYILPKYLLEEATKLMHDSIVFTGLDKIELEKEKEVILEEYNLRNSDPDYYLLHRLMPEALYQDQFFRFDVIGDMEIVKSATVEKLKNIKDKYFIPKNSALLIVGDFELESTKKMVSKIFSDWQGYEKPELQIQPVKELNDNIVKINYMQNPYYAKIYIMLNGPGKNTQEGEILGYAADILLTSLKLNNHPFGKDLAPYVYSWDFYYQTSLYDGPIYFMATVPVNQVLNVYKIFKENFNKIINSNSYWNNAFLQSAKQSLAMNQINLNKIRDIEIVGSFISRFWSYDYFPKILDLYTQYNSITEDNIKEFIERYFKNKFWVLGLLINKEKANSYQYEKLLK
ncbi:MAG: M16 family metallopeptidase [Exilispira sp.]